MELPSFDRGNDSDCARCGREAVDARREQRLNRRRHRTALVPAGGHQLLEEERVALGDLDRPRACAAVAAGGQVDGELFRLLGGERLELQRKLPPGRSRVEHFGPAGAEDQHCRSTQEAAQVVDEVEERRLRPVQVVGDEHDRPLGSDLLEQPPHRPAHLGALRSPAGETDR